MGVRFYWTSVRNKLQNGLGKSSPDHPTGETLAVSGQPRGQAPSDCPLQGVVATDPHHAVSDADASHAARVSEDAQDAVRQAQGHQGHTNHRRARCKGPERLERGGGDVGDADTRPVQVLEGVPSGEAQRLPRKVPRWSRLVSVALISS